MVRRAGLKFNALGGALRGLWGRVQVARRALGARIRKVSYWLRDNAALIKVLCAILTVFLVGLGTGLAFFGTGSSDGATEPRAGPGKSPLTAIGQAREVGGRVWGSRVELPEEGGRVNLGLRVHNNGSTAITNVAVRMPVPDALDLVPGSCRLGIDAVADQACQGAVAGEGTVVGELPPQGGLHIVLTGEVAPWVPGGKVVVVASVGSDETEELNAEVEVVVSPSPPEEAVRTLVRDVGELARLAGPPEEAARSRHVLIQRWADLGLAPDREFGEMPEGRSVGLLRLYYDRRFDGQVVEIRSQILSPPLMLPVAAGAVAQSMEIGSPDGGVKGWCFTVRSPEDLLHKGDWVEVKALPIGWGGFESLPRPEPVTLLACSAMQLVGHGELLGAPSSRSPLPWTAVF